MPLDHLAANLVRTQPAQRPFITLAYAQSLDGSITVERGRSLALSGPEALELTHRLRSMHDGILAGIGTVLTDDPRLDVRLAQGASPRPIVVDSRLRIPSGATLLGNGRVPWVATTEASAAMDRQRLDQRGAEILVLPALANGWVDLTALCSALFERGVRALMVEGGARIISSFLAARLADHLVVTVSPRLLDGLAAVSRAHPLGPFELPQLGAWQTGHFGSDCDRRAPELGWLMGELRRVLFTGPRAVEVQGGDPPVPSAEQLLVRSTCSAISAGTELLAYRGALDGATLRDPTLASLGGTFAYPFTYGYAAVGEVVAQGAAVASSWRGRRVVGFVPHASHFVVTPGEAWALPEETPSERGVFLPNAETAVGLIQDARPILGERVVVLGQGVVGSLVTGMLARFPLGRLVAVDPSERRRELGRSLGSGQVPPPVVTDPGADVGGLREAIGGDGADLVFEVSGDPAALELAVALCGPEGRVLVGSWYGDRPAAIELGTGFHRKRLGLVSSQVSSIGPALRGRWDRERRLATALGALDELRAENWISHRISVERAAVAYETLDRGGEDCLQILLTY